MGGYWDLASIKNAIELWKDGGSRSYPMILNWDQIHWLIARVEELEASLQAAKEALK